jgi:hypothetical protein
MFSQVLFSILMIAGCFLVYKIGTQEKTAERRGARHDGEHDVRRFASALDQ